MLARPWRCSRVCRVAKGEVGRLLIVIEFAFFALAREKVRELNTTWGPLLSDGELNALPSHSLCVVLSRSAFSGSDQGLTPNARTKSRCTGCLTLAAPADVH